MSRLARPLPDWPHQLLELCGGLGKILGGTGPTGVCTNRAGYNDRLLCLGFQAAPMSGSGRRLQVAGRDGLEAQGATQIRRSQGGELFSPTPRSGLRAPSTETACSRSDCAKAARFLGRIDLCPVRRGNSVGPSGGARLDCAFYLNRASDFQTGPQGWRGPPRGGRGPAFVWGTAETIGGLWSGFAGTNPRSMGRRLRSGPRCTRSRLKRLEKAGPGRQGFGPGLRDPATTSTAFGRSGDASCCARIVLPAQALHYHWEHVRGNTNSQMQGDKQFEVGPGRRAPR